MAITSGFRSKDDSDKVEKIDFSKPLLVQIDITISGEDQKQLGFLSHSSFVQFLSSPEVQCSMALREFMNSIKP